MTDYVSTTTVTASDQEDEELCAINLDKRRAPTSPKGPVERFERSVEKVLNPGRGDPPAEEDPPSPPFDARPRDAAGHQISGPSASLDMLCRVFPFNNKKNIQVRATLKYLGCWTKITNRFRTL